MSSHGKFTWYDLMTTDPEAGKEFYMALAGWGLETWGGPTPYAMWTHGGCPHGGVMQLPEEAQQAGAPPHWLLYMATDDVDRTVARTEELGGSVIVPAQDVEDIGRFAVLADPQGAVFSIFQTLKEDTSGDEQPAVGRFSWHELLTGDLDAAFAFYSDLFGWAKGEAHDMGEMGTYQIFSRREGTVPTGGMFVKPPEMPAAWLAYLRVDDAGAAAGRIQELGGQILNGPMGVPGGDQVAQCLDPQGAAFAIHSVAD